MKKEHSPRAQERLIAFVHVPKTAGTTLNSILSHQYSGAQTFEVMMRGMSWIKPRSTLIPKPLIQFSKLRRLKLALKPPHSLRLICGHFDMSLSKRLPADTQYFTLLRDPIERAISHYHHYRRMTDDAIHPLAMRSTLAQWVSACGLVEMDNGQTRRFAGEMNLPCGRVTPQILDRAKKNLAARFAVVGLTERFDETLMLLQQTFGWSAYGFLSRNIGKNRPPRSQVDTATLETIAECNRYDLNLYQYAEALFEQALNERCPATNTRRLMRAREDQRSGRADVNVSVARGAA